MSMKDVLGHLEQLAPEDIVLDEGVKARWIEIYNTIWGNGGEGAYERESRFYRMQLLANEKLRTKATKFSIFNSFVDLAVNGLSLEPGTKALCYLMGRNVKVGEQDSGGRKVGIYEAQAVITVSGYGELVMRARAGQIRHADNPVIVYKEDRFSYTDDGGQKKVSYTMNLPHSSGEIVACFLRITRNDGSMDYYVMFPEDWQRLKSYSGKNNRYWDDAAKRWVEKPNELYSASNGEIDPGFLRAKCIKHAFGTYPKVRIGGNTVMESDGEPQQLDDYEPQPAMPRTESFAPAADMSQGITVEPAKAEDDGTF